MQLVEVKQLEKDIYNRFVIENETGSFLQSWEWGSWQETLGRKILRYWILPASPADGDIGGQRIGSLQLIKMSLPMGKYYLYCPYGPIIGDGLRVTGDELMQELQKKFTDAIFIRIESKAFLPVTRHSSLVTKTSNIQPGKTLIIDLSKSEEELLTEMHHKTRYNIKLAKKHGVEIKDEFEISTGHGLFYEEAINLIVATAKRQGYKGYGASYYKKMIDCLMVQNRGDLKLHIYKAIFQNQLLSAAVMLDYGKTRTFLFGGSSEFHKNVMAPYLLHFQAMLDAKTAGLMGYDFWGIETASGDTPGFVRFKLGFSNSELSIKQYAGAYDLVVSPAWYRVYKVFRWLNRFL